MGLLIDGQWHDAWYDTKESRGRFVRTEAQFRNWITPDGAAGPSGHGGFERSRIAIISTSRSRARGRIAR